MDKVEEKKKRSYFKKHGATKEEIDKHNEEARILHNEKMKEIIKTKKYEMNKKHVTKFVSYYGANIDPDLEMKIETKCETATEKQIKCFLWDLLQ